MTHYVDIGICILSQRYDNDEIYILLYIYWVEYMIIYDVLMIDVILSRQ